MPFWPFKRSKPSPDQVLTLREIDDRLHRIERNQKALEADWADYQERFTRLLARAAKRLKDAEKAPELALTAPEGAQEPPTHNGRPVTTNPMALRIMGHGG